jgi:hypothetical protein
MGFIARNLTTNEVVFSKGADKIAKKVGCTASNITKFYSKPKNERADKQFKGWIITKCTYIENKDRGKNGKFSV